jgi:hypothetical protein
MSGLPGLVKVVCHHVFLKSTARLACASDINGILGRVLGHIKPAQTRATDSGGRRGDSGRCKPKKGMRKNEGAEPSATSYIKAGEADLIRMIAPALVTPLDSAGESILRVAITERLLS